MKGKLSFMWRATLALVLVLSLGVVMAAPVAAAPDVSNVWVQLTGTNPYDATQTSVKYSIYFTPGADLTAGTDTINLIFPSGTVATGASAKVYPDGDLIAEPDGTDVTTITASATRATVTTPVDLSAGVQVRLDIINVKNPAAGEKTLDIYTSQELTKVSSDTYTIGATSVTTVTIGDPGIAGATDAYEVNFEAITDLGTPWGKVTVIFPPEVTLPASMLAADVSFDGAADGYTPCTVAPDISGRFVTITVSEDVDVSADASVSLKFAAEAGIQNPTEATTGDAYVGKVYTTTDAGIVDADAGFDITPAAIAKLVFVTLESTALTVPNLAADLVVQTQDQHGNASDVDSPNPAIIAVSSTSGTGQFFDGTDWGVTTVDIAIGGTSKTDGLQYKDTTPGSYTITVDEAPSAGWASATWDITVEAAHSVSLYDENGVLIDDTYTTIQDAISDAAPGDTIKVEPGTYVEDLTVNVADLTIESTDGKASTTIEGGMTLSDAANDFVLGGSEGKGFTLQGSAYLVRNASGASDVTISYNTFDLTDTGTPAANGTKGILIQTAASCSGWTVTENAFIITDFRDQGIYGAMECTISELTVTNNTFTGTDNTLETSSMEICSPDITLVSTIISGNTITATEKGVVIGRDQAAAGLVTSDDAAGTLEISDNTFDGLKWGLEIINADESADSDQDLVVVRNTFSNNEYAFTIDYGKYIMGDDYLEPDDFTVQYNDFSGNTYAVYNDKTTAVDATYNWWGDVTGPSADPEDTTPTVYGEGDVVTETVVLYSPWLTKSEAECVTVSYPALTVDLSVGWNTLSTPAKLIATADSVNELVPTGLDLAYWYDAFNEGGPIWRSAVTHQLLPCDAVYIKMVSTQTVLFQIDGTITYAPSKDLAAGWNMVGQANLTATEIDSEAVASVSGSFSQLVSPSMNSAEWFYTGLEDPAPENELVLGEGYWIFMKEAGTLAGFTFCPIAPAY